MMIPIDIDTLSAVSKGLVQRMEDLEIKVRVDHPNYSIVEIGKNS